MLGSTEFVSEARTLAFRAPLHICGERLDERDWVLAGCRLSSGKTFERESPIFEMICRRCSFRRAAQKRLRLSIMTGTGFQQSFQKVCPET